MTSPLSYVLIADGTGDRALFPVIGWTFRDLWPDGEIVDPVFLPRKHKNVAEVVEEAIRGYAPDLVFVHRDAESRPAEERLTEIPVADHVVPIIPIRMTEAWLLIDEAAIRMAASNPNGTTALEMPALKTLEHLHAKDVLHELLKGASGNTGRRLKSFNVEAAVHRVAELIEDYSLLLRLEAYLAFRERFAAALRTLGKIAP